MGTSLTMPEGADQVSNFVEKPGQYHVAVQDIEENPHDANGNLIQNAEIKMTVSVLGGTEKSELKKTSTFLLFSPDASHKDGGVFASKILVRLARAIGVLPEAKPGERIEIDWSAGKGKQLVLFLKERKHDDRTYLEINGLNIYHVHDEEVKHVPKNEQALKLMGQAPSQPPQGEQPQQPVQQQTQPAASGGGVSFDDL